MVAEVRSDDRVGAGVANMQPVVCATNWRANSHHGKTGAGGGIVSFGLPELHEVERELFDYKHAA